MNIIIDIVICALILIFAIISYKKGFISTLIEFIGFFFSSFISIWVGKILASWIFTTFIRNVTIESFTEKIASSGGDTKILPEFIYNAANSLNIQIPSIFDFPSATETATAFCDDVMAPVIILIIQVILILILIPIFSIVFKLLSKLFKNFNKLPILGKLNEILGFVLGIAKGVVVVLIACWIIGVIVKLNGGQFLFFNDELLEKTAIFSFIQKINPLI